MIQFEKFKLANGLTLVVHTDPSTPMAVLNIMYNVGSRDEHPDRTGFAHLFEHLMFAGSANVPAFDEPIQMAGGENNAFTTNDVTSYYMQLPSKNIETAFWLESDRMVALNINQKSLDVQRKVVMEEYKEHYLAKPYGDAWHKLKALSYTIHPYQWMTIGKNLQHIEQAELNEVKKFFEKYYCPANAVLVVAGNVSVELALQLTEKWFGSIASGVKPSKDFLQEPPQTEARKLEHRANVPLDAIYKCWHVCERLNPNYYAMDLISDMLGGGDSSRLHQELVKEQRLFSEISCYHWGSCDSDLLTIEGKLVKGISMAKAEEAINNLLEKLQSEIISEYELQKLKNKVESSIAFEDVSLTSRAINLAWYEILGDVAKINTEHEKYNAVTTEKMQQQIKEIFRPENSNTLYYYANN